MQEIILFFKLLHLAPKLMLVDNTRDAATLATWFTLDNSIPLLPVIEASILCGQCYTKLGTTKGGALTIGCANCDMWANMNYRISHLSYITGLSYKICTYAFIKAIEGIRK